MRIIDRKWTELKAGYQAAQSLQARLNSEFDRAIEVGYQQQYARDVRAWKKKRQFFFVFIGIAPLAIAGLCLSAFYFREVACVIIYWVVLVLIILVTLGVAARTYIREAVEKPTLGSAMPDPMNLEAHWWAALAPEELAPPPGRSRRSADFLRLLTDLPDSFLARRGPLVEGEESLYVFAPSGPWIFTLRDWGGAIIRQDDVWKEVLKEGEPVMYAQPPDAQWVRLRDSLAAVLNEYFPQMGGTIQGGVVFLDPNVQLLKDQIKGNTAAYGLAGAWAARLRQAPTVAGLGLEMQLESLDALIAREKFPGEALDLTNSARDLAERLYREAVTALRGFVSGMLQEQVDRASASR